MRSSPRNTAEEEHKAELAQGVEAAIGDDPLGEGETHGTDADAGEYLNEEAKDGEYRTSFSATHWMRAGPFLAGTDYTWPASGE